ncbi:hypothetical protein DA078_02205 [Lactiplantibacillus plantarum]|nr:hypothetical protein DA078_02205 [Lactiplantibacillus plantarum]
MVLANYIGNAGNKLIINRGSHTNSPFLVVLPLKLLTISNLTAKLIYYQNHYFNIVFYDGNTNILITALYLG